MPRSSRSPRAGCSPSPRRRSQGTFALSINRSGVIVGYYITGSAPVRNRGFVLRNGKFTTVRVPLSPHSRPAATVIDGIADDGTISVGFSDAKNNAHSFIDRAGRFTTIAVPKGFETEIECISERGGLAVGTFQPTPRASTTQIGFTYRAGAYNSLRDPSAPLTTVPQCGNAAGLVVGFVFNSRGIATGFLFTPAKR